uniref:Uncharacterized protein n=1 Tax=Oryza glumipatula TaxID=40148 RepID=A0A0D9Y6M5_9ORYZ
MFLGATVITGNSKSSGSPVNVTLGVPLRTNTCRLASRARLSVLLAAGAGEHPVVHPVDELRGPPIDVTLSCAGEHPSVYLLMNSEAFRSMSRSAYHYGLTHAGQLAAAGYPSCSPPVSASIPRCTLSMNSEALRSMSRSAYHYLARPHFRRRPPPFLLLVAVVPLLLPLRHRRQLAAAGYPSCSPLASVSIPRCTLSMNSEARSMSRLAYHYSPIGRYLGYLQAL